MVDNTKFLRYGDCIYICSAEAPCAYLCARSILEERILFLQTPDSSDDVHAEGVDSTLYENQSELIFMVYPKLGFQADKNFSKLKPNDDQFNSLSAESVSTDPGQDSHKPGNSIFLKNFGSKKSCQKAQHCTLEMRMTVLCCIKSQKIFIFRVFNLDPFRSFTSKRSFPNFFGFPHRIQRVKIELMRKRLEAERDHNDTIIQRSMGTPVVFGSEIQLYHISSKSFVRATREKHSKMSELCKLSLSPSVTSGVYFKISPYLSFKREGEKISLKDFFLLENVKIQSYIVYSNLPDFPSIENKMLEATSPAELSIVPSKSFKKFLPLVELNKTFKRNEAGLRHQDQACPLGAKLVSPQNVPMLGKALLWGDYVRIRFILNNKQTGYFYCDNTIIGDAPYVYCRTFNSKTTNEKDSFQAIFQLVPSSEELFGKPVRFTANKTIPLRLRHVLTGRYLLVTGPNQACRLSETLHEYRTYQTKQTEYSRHHDVSPAVKQEISDPNIFKIIHAKLGSKVESLKSAFAREDSTKPGILLKQTKLMQAEEQGKKEGVGGMFAKLGAAVLDKLNSASVVLPTTESPLPTEETPHEKKHVTYEDLKGEGPVDEYVTKTRISLRNVTDDDEEYLSTNSVFSLETYQKMTAGQAETYPEATLTVSGRPKNLEDDTEEYEWMRRPAYPDVYFKPSFHKRNPLGRQDYRVMMSPSSDNYFHFAAVPLEQISEVMIAHSLMYPILRVTEEIVKGVEEEENVLQFNRSPKKIAASSRKRDEGAVIREGLVACIGEALESVRKLTGWLLNNEKGVGLQEKQKIMRELGLIDLMIDLSTKLFERELLKAESKQVIFFKPLTQSIMHLLQETIRQNKANNIYVFQWSLLLEQATLDKHLTNELGVDKLLSQIFYEQIIDINELGNIPNHLRFEDYDIKAMNIATSLYRYNPARSASNRDEIVNTLLMNQYNRANIFRKFEISANEELIVNTVGTEKPLKVDGSLEYREKKMFDFVIGNVNLVTEITRSKPQTVSGFLRPSFPMRLCTDVFESKKWNFNFYFRSAFLNLYRELYLNTDSLHIPQFVFPNNIKLVHGVKISDPIYNDLQNRKDSVLANYTTFEFNVKVFVENFLKDIHRWIVNEHIYVLSVLRLLHDLCIRGFYTREELKEIKNLLYRYLEYGQEAVTEIYEPNAESYAKKQAIKAEKLEALKNKKGRLSTFLMNIKPKKREKKVKVQPKTILAVKATSIETEEVQLVSPKNTSFDGLKPSETIEEEQIEILETEHDHEREQDKDPYSKGAEASQMIAWMQECLRILSFIECYELEHKIKDFFQGELTPKFYNETVMTQTESFMSAQATNKLKQEKNNYIMNFLETNFSSPNPDQTLLLIEMLLINNLSFTCEIVHLLYLNFNNYKQFLISLNDAEVITEANIEIFTYYWKTQDRLRLYKIELEALQGEAKRSNGDSIFDEINTMLAELVTSLYRNSGDDNQEDIYLVYKDYIFRRKAGKQKQELMRNLRLFETVADLFKILLEGTYCSHFSYENEVYLTNFMLFFLFFCCENQDNQRLVAGKNEFLQQLFSVELSSLQPLLLKVVYEVYRDNYSLLIQITHQADNAIKLILDKFFKTFKRFNENNPKNNEFYIQCLRVFPVFFQIRNNYLSQNQMYFATKFHARFLEHSNVLNMNTILMKGFYNFLLENPPDRFIREQGLEISVPTEISFVIVFLNTLSLMVSGPHYSNSLACLNNKYYLSISDVTKLIKAAGHWANVKLALVTYLNSVYIRNKKLEDNEVLELSKTMKEMMIEEIGEYSKFLRNRRLYKLRLDQIFVENYDTHYPIETEFIYAERLDDVYHQYVLYGIMESFQNYAFRLKEHASEMDYTTLDDYVSSTLGELRGLWENPSVQTEIKETIQYTENMMMPLEEPTISDLGDQEKIGPQRNDRKGIKKLRKEVNGTTNSLKKSEKGQRLKIWMVTNAVVEKEKTLREQLQIDFHTIDMKHNEELNIMVKYLMDLKGEHQGNFKRIVKMMMKVVASEEADPHSKQSTLQILRKLSNHREENATFKSFQSVLIQLDFIDFFKSVIIHSKEENDKIEYILGLVDFLDEADHEVQEEFYQELLEDEDNLFLETLKRFMLQNFEEFRENERNFHEQSRDIQQNAKPVVYKKMYAIIYTLELLRLSCENHNETMQNYLREQIQAGAKIKGSINFINLIADIFNRYTKNVNEKNAPLGLKILDTLIEMLQGPCYENQIALCQTKVLENLEDLILVIRNMRKKKDLEIWVQMSNKIMILIQATLEGTYNSYITNQVCIHINVNYYMERMGEIYNKYFGAKKQRKPKKNKKGLKKSFSKMSLMSIEDLEYDILENDEGDNSVQNYKVFLDEGVGLAIILKFLASVSPHIESEVEKFLIKLEGEDVEKFREFEKAQAYYNKYIGQIEIVNRKGDLQRILFPIEKKTKYLSNYTKEKFLDTVDRESANSKLFGLLRAEQQFRNEMNYQVTLRKYLIAFSLTYFSALRDLNLLVAFVTNLIIMFDKKVTNNAGNDQKGADLSGDKVIYKFGITLVILNAVILILWGIFQAPLEIKQAADEFAAKQNFKKKSAAMNLKEFMDKIPGLNKIKMAVSYVKHMALDTYILYYLVMLIFACLGTWYSKIFLAFLLFDIIDQSPILNNVVKSVTQNYKQLLMTIVLGILMVYIYGIIGYFSVIDPNTDDSNNYCSTPWHCFLSMAMNALTSGGGGVGDVLTPVTVGDSNYAKRYFFDLFYFLTMMVLLLNLIFGIIIDTFAELRDIKRAKDYDENQVCFICGLERTVFDKEGISFEKHTREEHNEWNYIYYLVYMEAKDRFEYNGTESYIIEKIENDDLSWFPIQRAMFLSENTVELKEDFGKGMIEKLTQFESAVLTGLANSKKAPKGKAAAKPSKSSWSPLKTFKLLSNKDRTKALEKKKTAEAAKDNKEIDLLKDEKK